MSLSIINTVFNDMFERYGYISCYTFLLPFSVIHLKAIPLVKRKKMVGGLPLHFDLSYSLQGW
jgi:hypothetical protein